MYLAELLVVALVGTAYAGCFGDGEQWKDDKDLALHMAKQLCKDNNLLQTYYVGKDKDQHWREICINHNNRHITFRIDNINTADATLKSDPCYDGLQKEINGCSYGGSSSYTNWAYK